MYFLYNAHEWSAVVEHRRRSTVRAFTKARRRQANDGKIGIRSHFNFNYTSLAFRKLFLLEGMLYNFVPCLIIGNFIWRIVIMLLFIYNNIVIYKNFRKVRKYQQMLLEKRVTFRIHIQSLGQIFSIRQWRKVWVTHSAVNLSYDTRCTSSEMRISNNWWGTGEVYVIKIWHCAILLCHQRMSDVHEC